MKPFPPTLRAKERYIAFEAIGGAGFAQKSVNNAIWAAVTQLIGEKGAAEADLFIVGYDEKTRRGMVRSNVVRLDDVIAALALVTAIDGKKAALVTLSTSGTQDGAEKWSASPDPA